MFTAAEILTAAVEHCKSGRRDLAIEWLGRALRLNPDIPEAHNNLGVVLAQGGRLREAVTSFRQATRLKPDFAEAHNNLGNALRDLGQMEAAQVSLEEALRLRPGYAEAHHNLGVVHAQAGRLAEAAAAFRAALHLKPDYADPHYSLGIVLHGQGHHVEARGHLQQAVRLCPAYGRVHSDFGVVLAQQSRLPEAVAQFQEALRLNPGSVDARNNLGNALRECGALEAAEGNLREVLRLRPDFAEAHNNLGLALREQNRLEEARACFKQAVRLNPHYASAHANLGYLLKELGELDAATECVQEALRHEPWHAGALSGLANLLPRKLSESDLGRIRKLSADSRVAQGDRCRLLYGLAHVLDARGEYGDAARQVHEANAIEAACWRKRGQSYDAADFDRFVERLEQTFTSKFFDRVRGWGLPSQRPVFIFGLPRSGTTLTEQILASHSQVHGGGELHFARDDFEALAQMAGPPARPAGTPGATQTLNCDRALAALESLDRAALERLAQRHLDSLDTLHTTAPHLTSKMPSNWLLVGLLAALFPQARFIHCRRDLRDVAVSCWMTPFQHLSWTCDFDHIAARFNSYRRLMAHWRSCLPIPMLEIDYEEIVADLEGTARRLVSWCGLEWEAGCLNFHQTRRPIRTASAIQVRQPLYGSSVGRWRNYASLLARLFERLPSET
jgi:tetratricopeptide (TPR) repeat protein